MRVSAYSQQAYVKKVYEEWQRVFQEYRRLWHNKSVSSENREYLYRKFHDATEKLSAAGHGIKHEGTRRLVDDAIESWINWAG